MEVRCSNCATEYEFDDALVSARGTSVKCTQCGHQFRVHARGASAAPETWLVRNSQGKERTFTSLRELQQAIVKGQLEPHDQISRGGQGFRPLEDIYELQTFFTAASSGRGRRPAPSTLLGVGQYRGNSAPAARPSSQFRKVDDEPVSHDRITPVSAVQPPPVAERGSFFPPASVRAPTSSDARGEASGAWPGMVPSVPPSQDAAPAAVPWQNLEGLRTADSDAPAPAPARSRWILALVVVGALGLVAVTVGRNYLSKFAPPAASSPQLDGRVPVLVQEGRALLDRGEFEDARAEFAKASVLAENDPQVAAAVAELELARADLLWLHREVRRAMASAKPGSDKKAEPSAGSGGSSALAPAASSSAVTAPMGDGEAEFQRRLTEQLAKARDATSRAQSLAPDALPVVRDRVDLLRLQGDLKQARELVARLSERASEPQNAYSLGVLDLAEGEAGYPSAIARLRVAARNEAALGRARAALILALAKTDTSTQAVAELDKLKLIAPNHALLADLGTLVERIQPVGAAPASASAVPAPSAAASAREPAPAAAPSAEPRTARTAPRPSSADPSILLDRAGKLYRQGDLIAAEEVYQTVLRTDPSNVQALFALGDIARQRHANATATAFYDQVLKYDPDHLQALMARADMQWHAGQQAAAVKSYRRVLGRVGSSHPYGVRALARIEEFERGSAPARPAAPSTATPPASSAAPASTPGSPEDESPSDKEPEATPEPEPSEPSELPSAPKGSQAGSSS